MLKPVLALIIAVPVMLTLPGCDVITGKIVGGEAPVTTAFGRMLGFIPYSVFQDHDIWFGNPGKVKSLYGIEDIGSIGAALELDEENKREAFQAAGETGLTGLNIARWPELFSLVGFDVMTVDRAIYGDIIPPHGFSILEGRFDEVLIGQKLTGLGYTKTEYGQYPYYGIRGDFETDIRHPLDRMVLGNMNRVAVLDDLIIFSPVTADITGIFDVMNGDTPSVINNAVCRALADSLGDVLMATLTTPERIIYSDLAAEEESPVMFDFDIPDNWGTLRGYEIAALGLSAEGDERFLDIALYYRDARAAKADGQEIVNRMQNYRINTWVNNQGDYEYPAFTERFQPGEPIVERAAGGAILTISCQVIIGGAQKYISSTSIPFRDLLFLAPDPAPYVGKKDEPPVIRMEKPPIIE